MTIVQIGSLCFGLVIGWITYRMLRKTKETVSLSSISTVIGAVGGAAVMAIFKEMDVFATYCIGLAAGFFLYLILGNTVFKNTGWLGGDD